MIIGSLILLIHVRMACATHHIRELTYAHEEDKQLWANDMKLLLLEINDAVNATEGKMLPDNKKLSAYLSKTQCNNDRGIRIIIPGEDACIYDGLKL